MKFFTICTLLDIISALAILFVFCYPKWNSNLYNVFVKTCFYVYGFFVLYFTYIVPVLIPIPSFNISISQIHINLVPFIDCIESRGDFVRQILLNVLMFVPLGIFLPFIYKRNFKITLLISASASFLIEIFQLFSPRQFASCDITDLITNILGGVIGFLICKLLGKPIETGLRKLMSKFTFKKIKIAKGFKITVLVLIFVQLIVRSVLVAFV